MLTLSCSGSSFYPPIPLWTEDLLKWTRKSWTSSTRINTFELPPPPSPPRGCGGERRRGEERRGGISASFAPCWCRKPEMSYPSWIYNHHPPWVYIISPPNLNHIFRFDNQPPIYRLSKDLIPTFLRQITMVPYHNQIRGL